MYKLSDGFGGTGVHMLTDWEGEIRWGAVGAFDGCSQKEIRLVEGTGFASNPLEKVVKFTADGKSCAGENNTGGGLKKGLPKDGANVDRGG